MAKWHVFKEQTVEELIKLGVPFRKAELAVLDLQGTLNECMRIKNTPHQTAMLMMPDVRRIYKF